MASVYDPPEEAWGRGCSGSEAGSYLRRIYFGITQLYLGLRVIKKKKKKKKKRVRNPAAEKAASRHGLSKPQPCILIPESMNPIDHCTA